MSSVVILSCYAKVISVDEVPASLFQVIMADHWWKWWTAREQEHYPEVGHSIISSTCFVCHSAQHRNVSRSSWISFVRWKSFVMSYSLLRRSRWLTVSYAAVRSTNTTPVGSFLSKPSSMCWVRLSTWPVQDFPGLKPACSCIRCSSVIGPSLFRISRSKSLKGWHKRRLVCSFLLHLDLSQVSGWR